MNWVGCDKVMPEEVKDGNGSRSKVVSVMLSDGTEDEDWLINGKWVIHCKKNGGAFPVKWRNK
mgnify:CR=1 FL=1